jgi:carbon monoxide dehydrogenase subunit G
LKISVSHFIAAPRERVFAALIDPEILRRAIPGCETLTATGPDEYAATLKVGVAGLKGTYSGKAAIRDRQPPDSLTLTFEGKGGPGFVRGSAAIALAPEGEGTRITSNADVVVGGLIATVGSRLVEAAAKKQSEDFFRQLAAELATSSPPP